MTTHCVQGAPSTQSGNLLHKFVLIPLSLIALGAISEAAAQTQHQFLGGANAVVWTDNTAISWSGSSPYTVPGPAGPTANSYLDMNSSGKELNINGGSRAVERLTLTSATAVQVIYNSSGGAGTLTIGNSGSQNGLLSLTTGTLNLRTAGETFDVVVNGNVSVGAGTALQLGNPSGSVNALGLTGFTASGTTTINGAIFNRYSSLNTSLGAISMGSTGQLYLSAYNGANDTSTTVRAVSLSGSGAINGSNNSGATGRSATLALTSGSATNATYNGVLANGTSGTNTTLNVSVAGSGRQALAGVNTYTGSTTVSGGTLVLSGAGSINSTSGLTITDGAFIQNSTTAFNKAITWTGGTVGGTQAITGNLLASGAGAKVLNPGDGATIGMLTVSGNITLDSLTTFSLQLASAASYDALTVGGVLSLNDTILALSTGTVNVDDVFTIATFGSRTGTFLGLTDGTVFSSGGQDFRINYNSTDIQLTAVPEPDTVSLALAAIAAMVLVFRRRSRRPQS